MYDLTQFNLKDMTACGAALRRMGADAGSMEEVADRIVHYLYDSLVDGAGQRAGVMVRFFFTVPYRELPDNLRAQADRFLDRSASTRTLKCQTLLATMGEHPDWRRRQDSRNFQAQPLTPEIVDVTPMLGPVSEMFGIALKQAIAPDPALLLDVEDDSYNIFHVPEAPGSPYVPAQKDFVIPYGIRSVLGFYGMLPSGNLFTLILFAKTPIARQVTEYFRPLALSVKMALLPFDGGGSLPTTGGRQRPRPRALPNCAPKAPACANCSTFRNGWWWPSPNGWPRRWRRWRRRWPRTPGCGSKPPRPRWLPSGCAWPETCTTP